MTPTELYDLFRSDMVDTQADYLWTDTEVWGYMDDAYSMFVRLMGGIADATSSITQIPMVADAPYAAIDPRILKIRRAFLDSTKKPLVLKNVEDLPIDRSNDYGASSAVGMDYRTGIVSIMLIGEEEDLVRWINVPAVNDTANLVVYRLPLNTIDADADDTALGEVHARHHRHLLLWMKHLAYDKQDAETYNKGSSAQYKTAFEQYCDLAKSEAARQKSKTRVVAYAGL